MKSKETLTPKDLAKIKVMIQYDAVKPLKDRIKVLENKIDYLNKRLMWGGEVKR